MRSTVKNKKFLISVFVLFGLCVAVHARGLYGQFMVDDYKYIHDVQNPIRAGALSEVFFNTETQHYNPLNLIVNRFVFKLFNEPFPLHVVNLFLFYVSCLILLVFVQAVTQNSTLAFWVSALFCIHPMSAEVIDHVTLNIIIIGSIFQQAALLSFWKFEHNRKKIFYVLSIFCFLGALLSHEMALLFPLFVFSVLYFMTKNSLKDSLIKSLPFLGIALLYFLLWIFIAGSHAQLGENFAQLNIKQTNYIATFTQLAAWYIRNLFFPLDIVFIKNLKPLEHGLWMWNALFFAAVALTAMVMAKWKKSFSVFALMWFWTGFLLAVPGVLAHAFMGMVIEPNWFFFSSQGFFMLIAWLLWQLRAKINRGIFIGLLASISLYWAAAAQYQHSVNRYEWGYAEHWLHNSPKNMQATAMMGIVFSYSKEYEVKPEFIPDMIRMAEIYNFYGRKEEALKIIKKLTKSKVPESWGRPMLVDLAAVEYAIGATDESLSVSAYLIAQYPGPDTYLQLSAEFDHQGMTEQALRFLDENIRLYPSFSESYYLYGIILANKDRWDEAVTWLEKGQAMAPADQRFPAIIKQIRLLREKAQRPSQ